MTKRSLRQHFAKFTFIQRFVHEWNGSSRHLELSGFQVLLSGLLGACMCFNGGCLPKGFKGGHFEGALLLGSEVAGETRKLSDESIIESQLVSIDLKFDQGNRGEVTIKDNNGELLYTVNFSNFDKKKFDLTISSIHPEPIRMQLDKNSVGCFVSTGDPVVEVCLRDIRFLVQMSHPNQVPYFTLSGDRFAVDPEFSKEEPVRLTLTQAVEQSLAKNFESRAQFERTMQARLSAKEAALNIIPHLNLPNLLTNFPLSYFSTLAVIGDLVPFLLPSRWFLAKETGTLSTAEKYAQVMMQADLATQVEGLGYSLQRDLDLLDFNQSIVKQAREAEEKIFALELVGEIAPGSTDHLRAFVNSQELESHALELIIKVDKRALAQALGYHNPEAIEEMSFGQDLSPLDQAVMLDQDRVAKAALQRSFELQQMDALIKYSKYKKKELYFAWLDPVGNTKEALGVGLSTSFAIGQSRIDELVVKREQLQSIVLQKVNNSVNHYNHAVHTYSLIKHGLEIHVRRVAQIIGEIVPKSNLNTMDINHVFEDYVAAWLHYKETMCEFRIARSNIDRMLLKGYYSSLFEKYYMASKIKKTAP